MAAHHPAEQPGADNVVGLRCHVHREGELPQLLVALPAAGDLRGQGAGGPSVHDIRVADETTRQTALRLLETRSRLRCGVDRQGRLVGGDRVVVVGLAIGVQPVPDRERDTEEALPADQPVTVQTTDPVGVAVSHVLGRPGEFVASGQQLRAQLRVTAAVGDVPLARRDDLERLVAALVEVRHAGGRPRFADQLASLPKHFDGALAGREGGLAGDPLERVGVGDPVGGFTQHPAVTSNDGAGRQPQLTPPGDVGEVTEGAAHCDAGPLVGLGVRMRQHGHLDPVDRRGHGAPEQRLITLVVGMGDQCAAGRQQFGTSGLDQHVGAV